MAETVNEGDKAPDFKGVDQDNNKISLKDFRGQKVALFFYPEDDTPTCTIEVCNLRDNHAALKKAGYKVIGVSMDSPASHQKFIKKFELPFTLIADTDKKIIDAYGVWKEKIMFGRRFMGITRQTFLIDEKGVVFKIFRKVISKNHAEKILAIKQ